MSNSAIHAELSLPHGFTVSRDDISLTHHGQPHTDQNHATEQGPSQLHRSIPVSNQGVVRSFRFVVTLKCPASQLVSCDKNSLTPDHVKFSEEAQPLCLESGYRTVLKNVSAKYNKNPCTGSKSIMPLLPQDCPRSQVHLQHPHGHLPRHLLCPLPQVECPPSAKTEERYPTIKMTAQSRCRKPINLHCNNDAQQKPSICYPFLNKCCFVSISIPSRWLQACSILQTCCCTFSPLSYFALLALPSGF